MQAFIIAALIAASIVLSPPVPSNKLELVGVKAKGYYPQTKRHVIVTTNQRGQTGSCYVNDYVGRKIRVGANTVCRPIVRRGQK